MPPPGATSCATRTAHLCHPALAEPGVSEAAIVKGTGGLGRLVPDPRRLGCHLAHPHGDRQVRERRARRRRLVVAVGHRRLRARARHARAATSDPEGSRSASRRPSTMPAMDAWRAFVEPKRRASWLDLAAADADRDADDGSVGPVRCPVRGHARERRSSTPKGDDRRRRDGHARQARRRRGRRSPTGPHGERRLARLAVATRRAAGNL